MTPGAYCTYSAALDGSAPALSELGRSVPRVFAHAVVPAGRLHVVLQPVCATLRPAILMNAVAPGGNTLCCVVSAEFEYAVGFATSNASEVEVFSRAMQARSVYCLSTTCHSDAV